MDFKDLNMNKIKIWLEIGLALLLVVVIGIAGYTGNSSKKSAKSDTRQEAQSDTTNDAQSDEKSNEKSNAKKKAEEENAAAKANTPNAATSDGKDTSQTDAVEEVIAPGQYPIMGKSSVTVEQMVKYYQSSGETYPADALTKGGAANIETFCQLYYDEATAEGVRPEVAFVQTMKETGWLQYGGDSSIEQFNFAGLGTTGGGVAGNSYADVRTGLRAQIQHLKAYATADALTQACVDERYEYVTKGSAPYVEWLGQQENPKGHGWATAVNYGYSIVDMISKLKTMK